MFNLAKVIQACNEFIATASACFCLVRVNIRMHTGS